MSEHRISAACMLMAQSAFHNIILLLILNFLYKNNKYAFIIMAYTPPPP